MDQKTDHFTAEGIPLTEFRDSAPTVAYPYQLATVIARSLWRRRSGVPLPLHPFPPRCAATTVTATVSAITLPRAKWRQHPLALHDKENADEYPAGFGKLMDHRPVLCATCHASNALGTTGKAGIPNLSKAMHSKHAGVDDGGDLAAAGNPAAAQNFCYNCHPGPATQCLRDVMSSRGEPPALPRLDAAGRTESNPVAQGAALRRLSQGSALRSRPGPLSHVDRAWRRTLCGLSRQPACDPGNSQPNDAIKFSAGRGHAGTLDTCTVCHATDPTKPGPHGLLSPVRRDRQSIYAGYA